MTLYQVQAIAYDNVADEVVEGATGGLVYDTLTSTTPITVYGNAGEPLASVTSNASGVAVFHFSDRLEGYLEFPGRPRIHVTSTAVPGLLAAAIIAQTASPVLRWAGGTWPAPPDTAIPVTWWSVTDVAATPPPGAKVGDVWKRRVA